MPRLDKNILTAQLEDAFEREICPLCYLRHNAEHRYLDMLLYEKVNDLGLRAELRRTHGFCRYHTYRMLEVGGYGSHAQVAIIYSDLVNSMLQQVDAFDEHRAPQLEMERDCPVCRTMEQTEGTFRELLVDRLLDTTYRERYRASAGLCMPHFCSVYALCQPGARSFLKGDQITRLRTLSADLGEFIRKSVVKTEPFGPERDVWIRAIRAYAGVLKI